GGIRMERLTAKTINGNVLKCCIGCHMVDNCNSPCDDYFIATDKLAAYEDTELEPFQIEQLKDNELTIKELKQERDFWEREAKKYCSQLGEIRILAEQQ